MFNSTRAMKLIVVADCLVAAAAAAAVGVLQQHELAAGKGAAAAAVGAEPTVRSGAGVSADAVPPHGVE